MQSKHTEDIAVYSLNKTSHISEAKIFTINLLKDL